MAMARGAATIRTWLLERESMKTNYSKAEQEDKNKYEEAWIATNAELERVRNLFMHYKGIFQLQVDDSARVRLEQLHQRRIEDRRRLFDKQMLEHAQRFEDRLRELFPSDKVSYSPEIRVP
jgi:hypothetical protein